MVEHGNIIYEDAFQRSVMRTDFASWVVCISIESLFGKVFELLEDDKTTRLFELSREEMVRVFELSRGEEVVGKMLVY